MLRLIWPILAIPLLGTLVNALAGRWIGRRAHWIAVPAVGLSFLFALLVFLRVRDGETFAGPLFRWINAGGFEAPGPGQPEFPGATARGLSRLLAAHGAGRVVGG